MTRGTLFISDLHLGDARWTEERYELLDDFFESFVVPHVGQIVIAGDLIEWLQYGVHAIRHAIRPLTRLMELAAGGVPVHYVIGNHDIELCVLEIERPIKFVFPKYHLDIEGRSFHIEHGHFHDPTIKYAPGAAGFFACWAGRALDKVAPGVEDALGPFKDGLMQVLDKTTGQKGGRGKGLTQYSREARDLAKGQHDFVVFGHTHRKERRDLEVPGLASPSATYVNTGDWQVHSDFAYFHHGELHLFSWEAERSQALAVAEATEAIA